MKKLLALALALVIALSLAACGGAAAEAPAAEAPAVTEAPAAPTDAKLAEELVALGDSAKKLTAIYNELIPIAQANGWDKDDVFVKEANATNAMIQVAGEIIKDNSMLEGKSPQDITDGLNEMATEWDTNIRAKVSETYEAAQ